MHHHNVLQWSIKRLIREKKLQFQTTTLRTVVASAKYEQILVIIGWPRWLR